MISIINILSKGSGKMAQYFGEKTWVDIQKAIENNAVIILPVGTTEEHGRHLPVETDAIIAEGFGRILGDACDAAGLSTLVMQTIHYGFSMDIVRRWPGCPNINTRTFADYIFDIQDSLIKMGFKKIAVLDCHGNHDCLLRMVMREIADKHSVFTMTLSPFVLSTDLYNRIKKDPAGDIHGGEWETSCILHLKPELVRKDEYTNVDAIRCNSPLRGPISTWGLQETKTGLYGDPTHSEAELGRLVLEEAVRKGLEYIKEFKNLI
jgi:creatinine amidohydrolase